MAAGWIKIIYRTFEPEFPDVISKGMYIVYKNSNLDEFVTLEDNFFIIFRKHLIILSLGFLSIVADDNHWFSPNGLLEILGVIFILLAFVTLFSFIPSVVSYYNSHIISKNYMKSLNENLNESKSYIEFCTLMSAMDKRYIMQLKRVSKSED